MNRLSFIVFFSVFLTLYLAMHYYLYRRISGGLALTPPLATTVALLFFAGAVAFVAGEFLMRHSLSPWVKLLAHFGNIWLGILSIALAVFIVRDIFLLFVSVPSWGRYSAVFSLALAAGLSLYSLYNVRASREIKEIRIPLRKLPAALQEFSIVQLSDLHLNYLLSPGWLDKVVEDTNRLSPDLIVITGDLIDADLCRVNGFCEALKRLKARYGVYAITGNHEYYAGMDIFLEIARRTNIAVLRNRKVTIANAIELVGIDDLLSAQASRATEGIARAMSEPDAVDLNKPVILLSHRPDTFDAAARLGVDLQLSGHTHAGQIPPMDLLVMLAFKYPTGLYRLGASYAYITTGTGYWGPPMRLFSRSEIVRIVLEPENRGVSL